MSIVDVVLLIIAFSIFLLGLYISKSTKHDLVKFKNIFASTLPVNARSHANDILSSFAPSSYPLLLHAYSQTF